MLQLMSIKILNWINFEDWVESLKLYLALTNLDLAFHQDKHVVNAYSAPM